MNLNQSTILSTIYTQAHPLVIILNEKDKRQLGNSVLAECLRFMLSGKGPIYSLVPDQTLHDPSNNMEPQTRPIDKISFLQKRYQFYVHSTQDEEGSESKRSPKWKTRHLSFLMHRAFEGYGSRERSAIRDNKRTLCSRKQSIGWDRASQLSLLPICPTLASS